MLVDSYISNGYDVSYYSQSCNLIKNNRLSNNTQIEQDGSCLLCNDGISINTISIQDDIGKN